MNHCQLRLRRAVRKISWMTVADLRQFLGLEIHWVAPSMQGRRSPLRMLVQFYLFIALVQGQDMQKVSQMQTRIDEAVKAAKNAATDVKTKMRVMSQAASCFRGRSHSSKLVS